MSGGSIKDGGPAFPHEPYSTDARRWSDGSPGMSLRDWFAGKAEGPSEEALPNDVATLLGIEPPHRGATNRETFLWWRKAVALWKYAAADAMLAARNAQPKAVADQPHDWPKYYTNDIELWRADRDGAVYYLKSGEWEPSIYGSFEALRNCEGAPREITPAEAEAIEKARASK